SSDQRRQEILEGAIDVYAKLIQALVTTGQLTKAIEYVEQSRAQRLVALMATKDLYADGNIPSEVKRCLKLLDKIQGRINRKRSQWENNGSDTKSVSLTRHRLWQINDDKLKRLFERKNKVWQKLYQRDEVLAKLKEVRPLDFAAMQQLLRDTPQTAILNFYSTHEDTYIFILRHNQINVFPCQGQGETLQIALRDTWFDSYKAYNEARHAAKTDEEKQQLDQEWQGQMTQVLADLAQRLQLDTLIREYLTDVKELILIPHRYLHLIPFAALPVAPPSPLALTPSPSPKGRGESRRGEQEKVPLSKGDLGGFFLPDLLGDPPYPPLKRGEQEEVPLAKEDLGGFFSLKRGEQEEVPLTKGDLGGFFSLKRGEQEEVPLTKGDLGGFFLSDYFLIRTLPSCQILEFCQKRLASVSPETFRYGVVENAQEDLTEGGIQGQLIGQLYQISPDCYLKGKQATVENYEKLTQRVQGLHSSHHATSNITDPLASMLLLANGTITLGDLLTPRWRFPHLWDVFLSCCETAVGDVTITDDILTLAAGFLCAGSISVVSTLWAVNDQATAVFSFFYHKFRQAGLNRPQALQQAQQELRTLTVAKAEAMLKKAEGKCEEMEGLPEAELWEKEADSWNEVYTLVVSAKQNVKQDLPFDHPYYWAGFVCQGTR
ncbi:MAG: CHAT domain-containing protein, partial [Chroococcales cyanobacterium]